ncbi:hypothetical protein [Achromobacter sp. UMC46]|uniref:hypothetical protein n=1 Tax=Achromobacter sp. UMC46 TaxID=1862319 RepID=UPI0016010FC4|nr:hypothetical protein [Achromobacter sp. UMC46]MBB1598194.1 hypothetical protein [Achromobacter sp. UMC46]
MPYLVTYLTLLGWHYQVAGAVSFAAAGWLLLTISTAVVIGDLFCSAALKHYPRLHNVPTRVLIGLLLTNLILFLTGMLLPYGLAIHSIFLLIAASPFWLRAFRAGRVRAFGPVHASENLLFLLGAVAVTVWCWDILQPIKIGADTTIIRAWMDIFYHLSQIASFASSRGLGTLFDVQMAGAPAQPYHMASYMLPAALVDATGISTYVAYASLLTPLGMLLTVLGAYSLGAVAFGKWPALAGAAALILLPDAAQQGFGNPFLGYHWLQQIAPAQMYGVASAAVVFALVLESCRSSRLALVLCSYFFVLATLLYKAQIFVAISFMALMLPAFYLRGSWARFRAPILITLICLYFSAAAISQLSTSVPTLRLDGSGLSPYIGAVMALQDDGFMKGLFSSMLDAAGTSWLLQASVFSVMLLVCTFGVYLPAYLCLMRRARPVATPLARMFPLLVVCVYLVMATSLALDERHIGTMEELLHRPFVWAYFVVVVFFGGGLYASIYGDELPARRGTRLALLFLAVLLFSAPLHYGRRIQTFKTWQTEYLALPTCQVDIARYIKVHSQPGDIVQDSLNDPGYRLTALSERKPYAIDSGGVRLPAGIKERLEELAALKRLESADELVAAMRRRGIRWYVVNPGDSINWVDAAQVQKVLDCGGYALFKF